MVKAGIDGCLMADEARKIVVKRCLFWTGFDDSLHFFNHVVHWHTTIAHKDI